MNEFNGEQYKNFRSALSIAFKTFTELEQMVKHRLNEDLEKIAGRGDLSDVILNLIRWAEAQGRLDELVTGAHEENPGNDVLKKFLDEYHQQPKTSQDSGGLRDANEEPGKDILNSVVKKIGISSYIIEAKWVKRFGFESSPFENLEADNIKLAEPGFLAQCFIDPGCFLDILGQANSPTTTILYAKRGEGKTAFRVMIDYLCQHGGVPGKKDGMREYVLSVPHIYMREITGSDLLNQHVIEILRRAMPQFVDIVMDAEVIARNIREATNDVRIELNWYINHYSQYLNQQQIDSLAKLGINFPFDSTIHSILIKREAVSPLDHLKQWCSLMRNVGIKAVYVLVDGIDEIITNTSNIEEAYRVLTPLIKNRELTNNIPNLALKFFIPTDIENYILTESSGRLELIPNYHVAWSSDHLITLLRDRIHFFYSTNLQLDPEKEYPSEPSGFEDLCDPEVYGIEQKLLDTAGNNPRHLLKLCDLIVKARCRSGKIEESDLDSFKLTQSDFSEGKDDYNRWIQQTKAHTKDLYHSDDALGIGEIIRNGENENVEFKASLFYRDKPEKHAQNKMATKIGEEIAGMLNRDGGILLIGVNDDQTIGGIEGDFELLGQRNKTRDDSAKKDLDGFQLRLADLIKHQMGQHVLGLVRISFDTIDDHQLCILTIKPSPREVYYSKDEKFFIRSGSSNVSLSRRETVAYIQEHWNG